MQVADAERATRDVVDHGAVAAAVIGEYALDGDPVPAVESDGTAEEGGGGACFLVGEYLGVGEAAVVVDSDVDVFVADAVADNAGTVGVFGVVVLAAAV